LRHHRHCCCRGDADPATAQQAATPQQPAAGQLGQSAGQHALDIGQFPPYKPARLPDGHPDLNGYWQSMVSADWDLQDHEAQPGPKPEINGVYGAGPADKVSSRAAKYRTVPKR